MAASITGEGLDQKSYNPVREELFGGNEIAYAGAELVVSLGTSVAAGKAIASTAGRLPMPRSVGIRGIGSDTAVRIGILDESLKPLSSLQVDEKRIVIQLLNKGKDVKLIPETPNVGKTYDFLINGIPTELKTLNSNNINTLVTKVGNALKQLNGSGQIIYDISKAEFTTEEMIEINARLIGKYGEKILDRIIFIK